MVSSSGVHLEFSFNRLSPKVDIGSVLLRWREGEGYGWGGRLVGAFGRDSAAGIYVLYEASPMVRGIHHLLVDRSQVQCLLEYFAAN
jgi:hypothetical protein